jgi:hypothetical protein
MKEEWAPAWVGWISKKKWPEPADDSRIVQITNLSVIRVDNIAWQ